ncbi:Long chain acyl-CoA synthetase 8 [Halotydeus destructor]|nr:Long chain acyl-CoA synthetase 8 [Halotydeus destructor]
MDFDDHSFGRTGGPLFGVKLRLTDWREGGYFATDKPHPRGEIVVGGPHIADGYFKQEELTKESFFVENGTKWWYTGDIGEMYPDGTLKIIDRKKDLVKLQHGEYISLGKVEAALSFCDYVDNICVHGDSMHNNVIALIVPNRAALRSLADNLDKSSLEFSQLCQDRQVIDAVKKSLTDHGLKSGLMRVEIPSDIKLCPEDWIPDTGLVTAALKIRRKQITEFYKSDILSLYGAKQAAESSKSS